MSSLKELVVPETASEPDSDFNAVMVLFIPMNDQDGPCSFVELPARATPYTIGEVLLCADLSANLFEAIGNSSVKLMSARGLRELTASDEVESGDGICIERLKVEPKHGTIAGSNTSTYRVQPTGEKKKRRFF